MAENAPSFNGYVIGFDGPVDGDVQAGLLKKYPQARIEEDCNERPTVCVRVPQVVFRGYALSPQCSKQVYLVEIEVDVITADAPMRKIGYASNLAFVGPYDSEEVVARIAVNNAIKRLFGASIDGKLSRALRNINPNIKPFWQSDAQWSIDQAFGSSQ